METPKHTLVTLYPSECSLSLRPNGSRDESSQITLDIGQGDRPLSDPQRETPTGEEPDEPSGVERWVLPYFEDSSLWPVLLVGLGMSAAILAAPILSVIHDLNPFATVGLVIVAVSSFRVVRWEWRLRGRPGGIGVALVLVWVFAFAGALLGIRAGLL